MSQNDDITSYLYDAAFTAYKEYPFSPDFLDKLVRGDSINDLISGKAVYRWIFPSRFGYYTVCHLGDGVWRTMNIAIPTDSDLFREKFNAIVGGIVNIDQIDEAIRTIKKTDPSEITDIVCAEITGYHGKYVCITTEKSAYLIQFSAIPDPPGLENGKLYELSEANKILHKNFGFEDRFTEQNVPATGDRSEMLCGTSFAAAAAMIFTAKKRKRSR